jgi:septum formation topological specificity factor MinE
MTKPSLRETQQTLRGEILDIIQSYVTCDNCVQEFGSSNVEVDKEVATAILEAIKKRVPKKKEFKDSKSDRTTLRRHGYNECIDDFTKGLE